MQHKLKLIHTVGSLDMSHGGPSRTVPSLCEGLADLGIQTQIVTRDCKGSHKTSTDKVKIIPTKVLSFGNPKFCYPFRFRKKLIEECKQPGMKLIHDHGVWLPTNYTASRVAQLMSVPLVISPRGMLEPWAIMYKAWKKRLAWRLYQFRAMNIAHTICTTSEMEATNIRRLGLRQPIAIIPNGVEIPTLIKKTNLKKKRTALFLSRIHPKKGLLFLIEAWKTISPLDWQLLIVGPDDGNYGKQISAAVKERGLEKDIKILGEMVGEHKSNIYRNADLFILPSLSENFGMVVAEALSWSIPVITTKATPWQELETNRCGWWIDTGISPLIDCLKEVLALTEEELEAMGIRGRNLVKERYRWSEIAQKTYNLYLWILGHGQRPSFVSTD